MMRILVTGAQGFFGRRLVTTLQSCSVSVIPSGRRSEKGFQICDLLEQTAVGAMFERFSPDRVVHCAAGVPKTDRGYGDRGQAAANLQMLDNILKVSRCPVIYISSMTVYGTLFGRPVCEADAGTPTSAYGKSKLAGEKHLETDGRPGRSVRLPGLFGLPRRQGIVHNVLQAAKFGLEATLPRTPIIWAAMHVDDAALSVAVLATSQFDGFHPLNVGYPGRHSINYLLQLAGKRYNTAFEDSSKHPEFEFDLTLARQARALPMRSFEDALFNFGDEL